MIIRTTHDNALDHLGTDNPGGSRPVTRKAFGKHLIIDLHGCTFRVSDAEAIARYAGQAVDLLKMKQYGPPQVYHFGHADPATSGYTAVQVMTVDQLIETSNISGIVTEFQGKIIGHFVDAERTAHLDVFSCQEFDDQAALTHAEQFYGATASVASVLYR